MDKLVQIEDVLDSLPDHYSPPDRELIMRAYRVAEKAHADQKRASGHPYITHCNAVAQTLAEMRLPPAVVAAGLLHDTVEDTDITLDDLKRDFGEEICRLVDGVTKLTQLPRVSRGDQPSTGEALDADQKKIAELRRQIDPDDEAIRLMRSRKYDHASESLRKTLLAMVDDVRVVLIKLADRLHNMDTLGSLPEQKRRRIANETLDIFAPLANRLGIWNFKWKLEDQAFRYVEPESYSEIVELINEGRDHREQEMRQIGDQLEKCLNQSGIEAKITSRPKHIFSIYKKMVRKGVPFESLHDIRGVRIIVKDIPSCYSALGIIHNNWRPIPGEFDDYIAAPKDNLYRSLHTAVNYDDGKTLEIQIRTANMHQDAEYGIASHWRYKEGSPRDQDFERHITYLRSLMEWRQDVEDAREFVDGMKSDVFGDREYVFTPRGDIIDLPSGSTPIDFAYQVHTDVGHRCRGAKINGKLVSLEYQLKTGDKVEILTAKSGGPSRDWLNPNLNMVKTTRAKAKIRQWFKRQTRDKNIAQGKDMLEKDLRRLGLTGVNLDRLARDFDMRSVDELHLSIGTGDIQIQKIISFLTLSDQEEEVDDIEKYATAPSTLVRSADGDDIAVRGLKGLLTNIARCCNPAPGDEIVGYITRGRGATIHRKDCPNILRIKDKERLVHVSWDGGQATYPIPIRIKAFDRDGLMKDVSTLIANEKVNMPSVNVKTHSNLAVFDLVLEVFDLPQLSRILDRLENLPNVLEAQRVRPG